MAKKEVKYTCTAEYTEGCDRRLTEALVDIYYNRLRGISGIGKEPEAEVKEETPA